MLQKHFSKQYLDEVFQSMNEENCDRREQA